MLPIAAPPGRREREEESPAIHHAFGTCQVARLMEKGISHHVQLPSDEGNLRAIGKIDNRLSLEQ